MATGTLVMRLTDRAAQSAQTEIVCYDTGYLDFLSFYALGFHEMALTGELRIRGASLPGGTRLAESLEADRALLLFEYVSGAERFFFCIDAYDDPCCVHHDALARCRMYFKVNYDAAALRGVLGASHLLDRIHPVNPPFPLRLPLKMQFQLPGRYRVLNARRGIQRAMVGYQSKHRTLQWMRNLRSARKRYDVYLALAYYRSGQDALNERRLRLFEAFHRCPDISGRIGFFSADPASVPGAYRRYLIPQTSREVHLRLIAESSVSVYVRGVDDCISFKFGEQLALGAAVVGHTLCASAADRLLAGEMRGQYAFDEPEAVADGVRQLLAAPGWIRSLQSANARWFDQQLAPGATARSMVAALRAVGSAVPLPARRGSFADRCKGAEPASSA